MDAYLFGYLVMAIVVVALTIPATLFLVTERPSQLGLSSERRIRVRRPCRPLPN